MRKLLLLFCIVCLTSFSTFAADEESPDDDISSDDKKKVYRLAEDVNLVPSVKIQYGKPRIVVKAVYPLIESHTQDDNIDQFNQLVDELIQNEVQSFTQEVANHQDVQANYEKSDIKNDLNIDFDSSVVNINRNPIISIRFTIHRYVAGLAHPEQHHRVLNYDLYKGEQIELSDLFKPDSDYLNVISDVAKESLMKRLKVKDMVSTGTAPTEDNFRNWNINPQGILITFDKAQVAPSVYGTQSVIIPYAVLKSMVVPNSAFSKCLIYRKRCLNNNLLTGGFIDEAAAVHANEGAGLATNVPRSDRNHRVLNPILRHG